jgi:hypothetical protein
MSNVSTPTVPPEVLKAVGEAVAEGIAAQGGTARPVVEMGMITGGVTLKITYDTVIYALVVQVPSKAGDAYVFKVTMTKQNQPEVTLASFEFVDANNWKVVVSAPQFSVGPVTVDEISVNLSNGTVPTTGS